MLALILAVFFVLFFYTTILLDLISLIPISIDTEIFSMHGHSQFLQDGQLSVNLTKECAHESADKRLRGLKACPGKMWLRKLTNLSVDSGAV